MSNTEKQRSIKQWDAFADRAPRVIERRHSRAAKFPVKPMDSFETYVSAQRWLAGGNLPGLTDKELDQQFKK